MSQFYEFTKYHFAFLQRHGYVCAQTDSMNSVSFVGENNQIDITFSTIGYELTCQFIDAFQNSFTLQDALGYVGIREFKGIYQVPRKAEIEKGIIYLADAVEKLINQIDISDALVFQKILHYRLNTQKELLEVYYCRLELKSAEEYWKSGEYSKAQALYEKHISSLSNAQIKRLEYLRKKV